MPQNAASGFNDSSLPSQHLVTWRVTGISNHGMHGPLPIGDMGGYFAKTSPQKAKKKKRVGCVRNFYCVARSRKRDRMFDCIS